MSQCSFCAKSGSQSHPAAWSNLPSRRCVAGGGMDTHLSQVYSAIGVVYQEMSFEIPCEAKGTGRILSLMYGFGE